MKKSDIQKYVFHKRKASELYLEWHEASKWLFFHQEILTDTWFSTVKAPARQSPAATLIWTEWKMKIGPLKK